MQRRPRMSLVLSVVVSCPEHEIRAGDYIVIRDGKASLWRDLPDSVAQDLVLTPVAAVASPPPPPPLIPLGLHPRLYRRLMPVGPWLMP